MACQYVLILTPCCPVVLKETLDCAGSDTLPLRVQGGRLRAFAGRGRREISLKDSSIRDLTWALIISWAPLQISLSNRRQIWQAPALPPPPTSPASPPLISFIMYPGFTVIKDPFSGDWDSHLSAYNREDWESRADCQTEWKWVFRGTHASTVCWSPETKSICDVCFFSDTSCLPLSLCIWIATQWLVPATPSSVKYDC